MTRTIKIPVVPTTAARPTARKGPDATTAALLASVAGEEDPGAAVDAPVASPRAPLSGEGGSPAAPPPDPSRPSRSS